MNWLKPGGLALVVKSRYCPANLGKCVTTERLLVPDERIETPVGQIHNWFSRPIWYCTGNIILEFMSGRIAHGHAVFFPESLSPMNGDPDEELLALPDYSRRVVLVPALSGPSHGMLTLS